MSVSQNEKIACLDVAYHDDAAGVACVLFDKWDDEKPKHVHSHRFAFQASDYQAGAFYKRELPFLIALLNEIDEPLKAVIVDGYVWLGHNHEIGLGAALYQALDEQIPVIGVAKNRFRDDDWSVPVIRGKSGKPLFVTAAGGDVEDAAQIIENMHGEHRIPILLKYVDRFAREALAD